MFKTLIIVTFLLLNICAGSTDCLTITVNYSETLGDTSRLSALDEYWTELSRTVAEGDFEGYKAAYHEDAVVVFATGENKLSMSISKALSNWKEGFDETKKGKVKSAVEFRLSQRINDENTAHETGIFCYSSGDGSSSDVTGSYVHFEMLMIKRDGVWLGLMELQKSVASEEEWNALK